MALSLGQKAGWGLADMGVVVFVVVKQLLVLAFLTNFLGVPAGIAGAVTSAVLIFDIVTDPLVGYFSDRTNTRWGRRFPWMMVGAVLMTVSLYMMFSATPDGAMWGNIAWVVAFFGLATVGFTFVAVPYSAMAGEMTQDPGERSAMTGWRMAFASIGILIGGALIPVLAGEHGFATAVIYVAPLIIGSIWLSVFMTRKAPSIAAPAEVSVARAASLVAGNRPFVILMVLYGIMTLAIAMITAGLPFAAIYLITDDGQTALSGLASGLGMMPFLFAAFVVGAMTSQVLWVVLSRRMGKTAALTLGLVFYIGVLFLIFSQLPATDATWMALVFVFAGIANGGYQQIPFAMYPDLMDVTRAESGEAIEGAFSAVWLFGQKVGNALAPLILGLILQFYGWQETTEGAAVPQSDAALTALQWGITFVPAAVLALAALGLVVLYRPLARAGALHGHS